MTALSSQPPVSCSELLKTKMCKVYVRSQDTKAYVVSSLRV